MSSIEKIEQDKEQAVGILKTQQSQGQVANYE